MRCPNQNHSKMNVQVRFCPQCGVIVNNKIPQKSCHRENHDQSRKQGQAFCSHCGTKLR